MIQFRKVALSFGAAAAAVGALTLLAPQTAHAVAAALVQVTNTTANPAITQDTSKQAGQLIHLQASIPPSVSSPTLVTFISISAGLGSTANYNVPGNQTLVIRSVDITPFECPASPISQIELFNNIGTVKAWTVAGATTNSFTYPSGIPLGPGTNPQASTGGVGCSVVMDVFGYLTSN